MPTLHCNIGNHDYWRDPQRGKPPLNCPEHKPEKPVAILHRHTGDLSTAPAVARLNATDLVPGLAEALAEQRMETLQCEMGHEWQRERQRGKRPSRCPEHRAKTISAPPSNKTTDHQARVIELVLENPRAASCRCGLTPQSSPAEIRALNGGCTIAFVCPVLDSVRRALSL